MIFLQGSPTLKKPHDINIGRLSGIVVHFYQLSEKNRLPTRPITKILLMEISLNNWLSHLFKKDAFQNYMNSIGKLGGQNKVPRLYNDRETADTLTTLYSSLNYMI